MIIIVVVMVVLILILRKPCISSAIGGGFKGAPTPSLARAQRDAWPPQGELSMAAAATACEPHWPQAAPGRPVWKQAIVFLLFGAAGIGALEPVAAAETSAADEGANSKRRQETEAAA